MTQPPPPPAIGLRWHPGDTLVAWTCGHLQVRRRYPVSPRTVTAWPDPPSVIVVEEPASAGPPDANAAVFNPDGTERLRLRRPAITPEPSADIGFDQVFAGPHGLVAVYATRVADFWGRPDLRTGEINNPHEWR
jgi:hypothetical protein